MILVVDTWTQQLHMLLPLKWHSQCILISLSFRFCLYQSLSWEWAIDMISNQSFVYIPPLIPFYYSLLAISCLASKFLHLALHCRSVSLVSFVVYLPTFFFQDVLVLILGRILFRGFDGLVQQICSVLGCSIAWGSPSTTNWVRSNQTQDRDVWSIRHTNRLLLGDRFAGRMGRKQ